MDSVRLAFALVLLTPLAAHSESSCLTPDRPAAFPATIGSATGEYSETTRHPATSSAAASETQYQLWLPRSGLARVQRDYWAAGGFSGTFELSPLAEDSGEPQRLRGIHGLPSSAWLLPAVLERAGHEGEPALRADTPQPDGPKR